MAQNGRLPSSDLAATLIGGRLRKDAAASADRLALAFYRRFGKKLQATDTYRDYATQVAVRRAKGSYAAIPGTSNHGWGIAVDFASRINSASSAEHLWMDKYAGDYGWENPLWARNSTSADGQFEPWHWEYSSARDKKKSAPQIRYPRKGEVGLGDKGAAVREVQTLLNKNLEPKNRVAVDGDFGFGTADAVAKYQESRGLGVTGTVGPVTKERLQRGAGSGKPKPDVDIYLQRGTQKKDQVKNLQRFLRDNFSEFKNLKVDGEFGRATERAVKFWQKKAGMKPVGKIGPKSAARLKELGVDL